MFTAAGLQARLWPGFAGRAWSPDLQETRRKRHSATSKACDGDADCVLTMLMMQYAFNRAGFLGNAAGVDMSRNAFHLSHCSAPLKMEGPDGPEAPYLLRRHAELRGGAVTEVHYRLENCTLTRSVRTDERNDLIIANVKRYSIYHQGIHISDFDVLQS